MFAFFPWKSSVPQSSQFSFPNKYFATIATNLAISLANLSLSRRVQTTLLASMCHAKKKHIFFDVDIVVKKNIWIVVQRSPYSYRKRYASSQWSKFVLDLD